MEETVAWLKGMGADVVTTPQDLKAALGEHAISLGDNQSHPHLPGCNSPWACGVEQLVRAGGTSCPQEAEVSMNAGHAAGEGVVGCEGSS
jgi:hypothetical protein